MGNTVQQMETMADVPITMVFGTEPKSMGKLRPRDIAEAAAYVRSQRVTTYLVRNTAGNGVPINPATSAIHAEALSRIQCTPVTLADILDDWDGRVKLVQLAARRGGWQVSETEIADKLDHSDPDFFWKLAELSGLPRPPKEPEKKPDPTQTSGTN